MLKQTILGLSAAAVLFATPVEVKAADAKVYKLSFADLGPNRGPRAEAMNWWASELDTRSKGQIKIEFFWSQSLVKSKDTARAVGSGLADMGTILGIYTPADFPVWNLANTPFAISDPWVGMKTWTELRTKVPELRAEASKLNVIVLTQHTTGVAQLVTTKKAVKSAADLKGLKIRASGGLTPLLKSLGAVPVSMKFPEVYAAFDRGTLDGAVGYISFAKSYKQFEVADHFTEANMGLILGYGIGINKKLYNGMPKNLQDIFVEVGAGYMNRYARNLIDGDAKVKAELIAGIDGKKMTFHQLADGERAKFIAAATPFVTKWSATMEKKGIDSQKIIALFEATRAKYRKELKEKGYPWER